MQSMCQYHTEPGELREMVIQQTLVVPRTQIGHRKIYRRNRKKGLQNGGLLIILKL